MSCIMFPRGRGPLVSVMIASRGRADGLKKTIASCYDLANDPKSIEIILKLDEDDFFTQNMVNELPYPIKSIVTPRGQGFFEMNVWVNMMAEKASGDWLILLNDDACIETPQWDRILLYAGITSPQFGYENIFLFTIQNNDEQGSYAWPCLRRKVFDILGHFSPVLACDLWVYKIMHAICRTTEIPIKVKHVRIKEGDETHKGIIEANEFMRWQVTSPQGLKEFVKDVAAITSWMQEQHINLKWDREPIDRGWYWWKIAEVASEYLALVSDGKAMLFPNASDGERVVYPIDKLDGWWSKLNIAHIN